MQIGIDVFQVATSAAIQFENFATSIEAGLSYALVMPFLNGPLAMLTCVIACFANEEPTGRYAELGRSIECSFHRIHEVVVRACPRVNVPVTHFFKRMGSVLCAFFARGERVRRSVGALALRERERAFRARLVDRLTDALRAAFTFLRELARRIEATTDAMLGPVLLGSYARQFVTEADTKKGILTLRLVAGRYELFNLTPKLWEIVMPMLQTPHPEGHVRLAARPMSALTRHDKDGDETLGELHRLKSYIHAVGKGRAGTGEYFLAPYPRQLNTVDA